jgi:hypothetical protein
MQNVSAAQVLDRLSAWIMEQVAEFPIRNSAQDKIFIRAIERCQIEALNAYRETGSFDSSVVAGKRAFKAEVVEMHMSRLHLVPSPTPSKVGELWVEGDEKNAAAPD